MIETVSHPARPDRKNRLRHNGIEAAVGKVSKDLQRGGARMEALSLT
ncbi:hypothetical protein [Mesorhizobium sp. CN2-181]